MVKLEIDTSGLRDFADRMSAHSHAPVRPRAYIPPSSERMASYFEDAERKILDMLDTDRDLAEQIGRYYQHLLATGLPPEVAAHLAAAYQAEVLSGR